MSYSKYIKDKRKIVKEKVPEYNYSGDDQFNWDGWLDNQECLLERDYELGRRLE